MKTGLNLMTASRLCFICLALVARCGALTLTPEGQARREVRLGERNVHLQCRGDEGESILKERGMAWVHETLIDPNYPQETLLTMERGILNEEFGLTLHFGKDYFTSRLTIKQVKACNDGLFRLQAYSLTGAKSVNCLVELVVFGDVETVKLSLSFMNVRAESTEPRASMMILPEGLYNVTCLATGINPGKAHIELCRNDKPLPTGQAVVAYDMPAARKVNARRYYAFLNQTQVLLMPSGLPQFISCKAKAGFIGAIPKEAGLPVNVIPPPTTRVPLEYGPEWFGKEKEQDDDMKWKEDDELQWKLVDSDAESHSKFGHSKSEHEGPPHEAASSSGNQSVKLGLGVKLTCLAVAWLVVSRV